MTGCIYYTNVYAERWFIIASLTTDASDAPPVMLV